MKLNSRYIKRSAIITGTLVNPAKEQEYPLA